jgi:hypothetical protein
MRELLKRRNLETPSDSAWSQRVTGGDEKGSLEAETVMYGRESEGTWTQD